MQAHDLADFVVIIDGVGQVGVVESFKHPELDLKGEYKAGAGLSGTKFRKHPAVGDLKSELTFLDLNAAMASLYGLSGRVLVIRAAYVDQVDAATAVKVTLRGTVKKIDRGEWKPAEGAEEKYEIALDYYKFERGDSVIDEVDIEAGKLVVGGNDLRSSINKAIGLS